MPHSATTRILYTDAPAAYDYAYATRTHDGRYQNRKGEPVARIEVPAGFAELQRARYQSGLRLGLDAFEAEREATEYAPGIGLVSYAGRTALLHRIHLLARNTLLVQEVDEAAADRIEADPRVQRVLRAETRNDLPIDPADLRAWETLLNETDLLMGEPGGEHVRTYDPSAS